MQSVGTRLREARIKKGYTLEEINARTRISLKNLNAIESDDLTKISSPFTYRSFVKQVAEIVGVDQGELTEDAQAASSTMPAPLVPGQEEEVYARPHQYQLAKPRSSWNWTRTALLAGAAGLVSVYLLWRNGGMEAAKLPAAGVLPASSSVNAPADRSELQGQQQLSQQQPNETGAATPTPATRQPDQTALASPQVVPVVNRTEQQSTPPPAEGSAPAVAPGTEQLAPPATRARISVSAEQTNNEPQAAVTQSDAATIHIELSAIEPTWISVSTDGKVTYKGTLAAMDTKSFDGRETAQIRTANAGGVNIIFNGRALGPLGPRGQARTVVFKRKSFEVTRGVGSPVVGHTGG